MYCYEIFLPNYITTQTMMVARDHAQNSMIYMDEHPPGNHKGSLLPRVTKY
jgi:hypothetical protein